MPWSVKKQGDKFAVVKRGGAVVSTHPSRAAAVAKQRALYANEPSAGRSNKSNVTKRKY